MLWNWYTVDSCFLASSWHVRSSGAFAGSCIGVIFLVIALEMLRRSQREFDNYVRRSLPAHGRASSGGLRQDSGSSEEGVGDPTATKTSGALVRSFERRGVGSSNLRVWQHTIRSLLYMLQFAVGYFIMLLAMYYNGVLSSFTVPLHKRDL